MATAILHTKIFVPRSRGKPIHRPRLVAKLDASLNGKFTLVSAPAGFGKTTLLLDWMDHTQAAGASHVDVAPRFCWLSLDGDDDEPARFVRYLVVALQEADDSLGQAVLSLLQSPQPPPLQNIIASLLNELALASHRSPIVLVLDDYHFIGNQAIHEALTYLLDHAPPTFHLVMTTRSDPPLPLAQMRVRGQMTEIRQADLRFTPQETGQFLDIAGIALSPAEMAALAKRTEGWVAALQLASLALQGQENASQREFVASFSGSYAHVVDYLMDQVWRQQPDEVRRFWLATSILDRLCAPLCDAVADRHDSRQMLDNLHRQNLFLIALDNERRWYRYHRLFADMLRARAVDLGAATIRQLHRRAAHWYEEQGRLPQAVHHALVMDDQAEATRLIGLASEEVLRQGQLQTIQKWLGALPAAAVRQHHQLALSQAWVSYLTGDSEAAIDYLAAAQKVWPETAEPRQRVSRLSLQAFMAMLQGDVSAGIDLSHQALSVSRDEDDQGLRQLLLFNLMQAQAAAGDIDGAARSGYRALQAGPEADNAFLAANLLEGYLQLLLMQGKFQEGIRLGEEASARFVDKRGNPLPLAAPLYVALGQLYLETGALDRADATVRQGIDLGQKMAAAMPVVNGKLRLAQIQTLRGQGAQALSTLDELQISDTWPQLNLIVAALRAESNLRLGNVDAALAWAGGARIPSLDAPLLPFETVYLAYARCLLAGEQWSDADALLARLADAAVRQGRAGSRVPIMVAQALSKGEQGQHPEARESLRDALLIAAPRGHKRPFLEELPRLTPLLQNLRPSAPDFVADLLGQSALSAPAADPSPLPDPLNERELEILRLIDAGNTNPEIARQLYLSVNTVKWYVKGIFQKLDVSARKQAAARARDLGLLR